MRRATVMALLVPLMLVACPRLAPARAGEVEKLKGEWELVSTADEKRTSPGSDDCKMAVGAGGRVVLKLGARTTNRGTIKLSRSGKVNLVDLKLTTGLFLGIWELSGDELVLCFSAAGKPRPAGLKPKGNQWQER